MVVRQSASMKWTVRGVAIVLEVEKDARHGAVTTRWGCRLDTMDTARSLAAHPLADIRNQRNHAEIHGIHGIQK